jgi:hypothetical protein
MYWLAEIHELIAGAEEEDLTKAFDPGDRGAVREQYVRVKQIDPVDLSQTVTDVLAADLQPWPHPWQPNVRHDRPRRAQRTEYYRWLLRLGVADRMIRYGCDGYFRPVDKPPRVKKPTVKRGHPNPIWLRRWQFGSHDGNCDCFRCQAWISGDWDEYHARMGSR